MNTLTRTQPILVALCFWWGVALSLTGCDFTRTGLRPVFFSVDSLLPANRDGVVERDVPGRAFPDVSIYVDGKPYGTYELGLPFDSGRMAVPLNGRHQLLIYGAVRADGRRSARVNYPFYQGYTDSMTFTPEGRVDLGTLVLKEDTNLARPFPLEERFDDASLTVDSGRGTYGVRYQPSDSILPNGLIWKKGGYGIVRSPAGKFSILRIAAKQAVKLPQRTSQPLYAELDYASSTRVTVGFLNEQYGDPIADVILTASPDRWRRVYIFLSDEAANFKDETPLRLFINNVDLDTTKANFIAVDNLKLLHYKPRR